MAVYRSFFSISLSTAALCLSARVSMFARTGSPDVVVQSEGPSAMKSR